MKTWCVFFLAMFLFTCVAFCGPSKNNNKTEVKFVFQKKDGTGLGIVHGRQGYSSFVRPEKQFEIIRLGSGGGKLFFNELQVLKDEALQPKEKKGLTVLFELTPGRYRVRTKPLYNHPWQTERVIEVRKGEPRTVYLRHSERKAMRGSIRLLDQENDRPLKVSHLYSEKLVGKILKGYFDPTHGLESNEKGVVQFAFWADIEKLPFHLSSYRYGECKRIFKKKQLVKGVTWKFKRRPARVRLKVLFRTRQGDRPYSKKLWREHFSAESLSGVFIRLPLGPSDGSAIYGVSFNEEIDRGELVRSQSEFVYRDLEPGTTYCITHCLLVDQVRFPLLKGTGKKVVAEKLAENPTTTVVIKTEPASYYDLTVRPVDKRDGSVLDRAAVFVSGHVRGPFGIGVVDVKLIEGLYEIEVKCADYATARKRVRLDKDQEITVELERLTEPVYWLYAESERLPRSDFNKRIAFDVYSKSDQGPVGGGFSEKARQKIARVPSGDYLVIAKGFRKGVEDKEPDNAVFAAREVKIKNADAVAEIDFDKENWTLFEVQFPKGGEVKQRLGAQLWGMWKGKTLRLGSGLLSKKNTARFSIPFDGNYWLEVLVPSKKHYEEEAKRYRKGKAYYTQRVSVKRGKTVTAKVVPSTSHKPTGEAPELADLPGSADVMEQDHIENDEPPGGSELQPSGSESSTNQWVLPAGIALGVLVIVGITVRAMKRKKRWGDQTQDGAT